MRKAWLKGVLLMFIAVFILSACSSGVSSNPPAAQSSTQEKGDDAAASNNEDKETNGEEASAEGAEQASAFPEPAVDESLKGEITFWTWTRAPYDALLKDFNKFYPNIKVKITEIDFGGLHDKLQTTLAAGKGAPDVSQVEQGQFPRYLAGDVLEDLLQAPYNASVFKDDTTEYNWVRWMNMDNSKLLAFPWDVTPGVAYYRADIFEELGLESDPELLGEYMADPENWMTVVETLTANGKYAMEWRDGPIHWAGDAVGYFDTDLNWVRNTDELAKVLDVTKRQNQMKVAPHMGMFDAKGGKPLVTSGKQAMVMLGSWGAREIESNFPDQKGKWRATAPPLGISWGSGGSGFVIPKQGKNKDLAWKWVEFMHTDYAWQQFIKHSIQPGWNSINAKDYIKEHTNAYLGGQKDLEMYNKIAESIQPRKLTALDGKAWPIWLEHILKAIDKNIDAKTTLNNIEDDINRKLKPDIDKLKKELNMK
ncbi:multiple sugar transport system substrate-binding protein [Paenibacillus rhizosphaerae]|uniref:Multiple sugar transport system substrate-binding protein n=1 Tax=Paenibacillus rhizosphaerae TaxID=297318 RepID=A0A839TVG1_9BACL|nr:extracellular solute-binding protein [Paenibacillus rhizosphaerae]MBB3131144.1 multiple sugar transport system substrate-binding protein [Paenibacillus rhizosphaerae]